MLEEYEVIEGRKGPLPRVKDYCTGAIVIDIEKTDGLTSHGMTFFWYECPVIKVRGLFINTGHSEKLSKYDQIMEVDNKSILGKTKQKAITIVKDSWASENSVLTLFVQKVKKRPLPKKFGHVSDRKNLKKFEAEIDENGEINL